MMNEQSLAQLRDFLLAEFNEDELASVCRDIGLDYAALPGLGAYGKSRELIRMAQARHVFRALLARVRDLRPMAYEAAGIATDEPETQPAARPSASDTRATPVHSFIPVLRLIGVAVMLILLAIALLNTVSPPSPAAPAPTAAPASTTDTTALAALDTPAFTPIPTIPTIHADALTAPTAESTEKSAPTHAARATTTRTSVPTQTPLPQSTPTISESHPAVQTVRALNEQLISFLGGKTNADALRTYWNEATYQVVLKFAYQILRGRLGADLTQGDTLQASMRYVSPPVLTVSAEHSGPVQVTAREYWNYTNPRNQHTVCETRDYHYTLVLVGTHYQVSEFRGDMVDGVCRD